MKSRLYFGLAVLALVMVGCEKAPTNSAAIPGPSFITHGDLDGDAHPAVVLIVMDIGGEPAFRCSGTLIAPKVVLTAGHCAGEPGELVRAEIVGDRVHPDDVAGLDTRRPREQDAPTTEGLLEEVRGRLRREPRDGLSALAPLPGGWLGGAG